VNETDLARDGAQLTDEQALLLVQIGQRQFALTLSEVRHIVPLPHDFPFAGAGAAEYYPFEGEPLRFVSGWDVMGAQTEYQEFAELQPMLPLRRQDHIDWMAALDMSIRTGAAFSKARDPHECAFGKWYYGYHAKDRRLSVLLSSFEQPHAHIHGLADQLLGLAEAGKRDEAIAGFETAKETTLANLLDLFDTTGQLLGALQRRIAIILESDDTRCALGVDMVLDIVAVANSKITLETRHGVVCPRLAMLTDERIAPFFLWQEQLVKSAVTEPDALPAAGQPGEARKGVAIQ